MKFIITCLLVVTILLFSCTSDDKISEINMTITINPEHQPPTYNLLVSIEDDNDIEKVTINIPELKQSRTFGNINSTKWQYEETLEVEGVTDEYITIETILINGEHTITSRSNHLQIK